MVLDKSMALVSALTRSGGTGDALVGEGVWSRAPGHPPVTLAIATAQPSRQRALGRIFGIDVHRRMRPCSLWLVPDVAIIDSPALLGQDDVARLLRTRALVLGAGQDVEQALTILIAGADGLLAADIGGAGLRDAVECVLRGEAVVPPAVATAVAHRVRAAEGAAARAR